MLRLDLSMYIFRLKSKNRFSWNAESLPNVSHRYIPILAMLIIDRSCDIDLRIDRRAGPGARGIPKRRVREPAKRLSSSGAGTSPAVLKKKRRMSLQALSDFPL